MRMLIRYVTRVNKPINKVYIRYTLADKVFSSSLNNIINVFMLGIITHRLFATVVHSKKLSSILIRLSLYR